MQTTIFHIEDEEDWRSEVEDYVRKHGEIGVFNYIGASSIDEIRKELASTSGVLIIIVDLRLGHSKPHYGGYHWLLEEKKEFIQDRPNTTIFVLSGGLHESVRESLLRGGVAENFIYDKEDWADEREKFILNLRDAIAKFRKSSDTLQMNKLYNSTNNLRKQVFISYSHKDSRWLQRMQVHLKPLERLGAISHWDDTMIKPGTKWRDEIRTALASARVAVLLVSADFLASDFITTNELPPLLVSAESEGAIIIPVIVSPCRFQQTDHLSQFQSVNAPSRPLVKLSRGAQEEVFVKVAESIEQALNR